MAWIRLDDGFADHPKILAAGPIAAIIQIRALCWSSRHLTDGFIPLEVVPSLLTGFEHYSLEAGGNDLVGFGNDLSEIDWPEIMVEHELWDKGHHKRAIQGFYIHDYLDYNRSKEAAVEMREKKASAGKVGGIQSGRSRREANYQAPASASGSEKLNSQSQSPSPKEKKKIRAVPSTDHARFMEYVSTTHLEKTGDKLLIDNGKDGKIVKLLLQSYPYERLCVVWDRFLVATDPFIVNGGISLGRFKQHLPALLPDPPPPPWAHLPLVCGKCGEDDILGSECLVTGTPHTAVDLMR